MKRVTVVGTGFGGLTAVRTLRKLAPAAEITVIGRKPELFYYPSLIWIPAGLRRGADLEINLENFFRRMRVKFHQGEARGIRDGGRTLLSPQTRMLHWAKRLFEWWYLRRYR